MITEIDVQIMTWIQENMRSEWMDSFMKFMTIVGDLMLVWAVVLVVYLLFKKQERNAKVIAFSLALSFIFNQLLLKNIVRRPRPFVNHTQLSPIIHKPTSFSFPSSHSATSFAVASAIHWIKLPGYIMGYILAGLIAFSRVYLCVHYPSDILVGAVVGCLATVVAAKLVDHFEAKKI